MIPSGALQYAFMLLFVRCSALLISAPVFGGFGIPVRARVGLAAVMSIALAPVIQDKTGVIPSDVVTFVTALAREASIGIAIGSLFQIAMLAAQSAGHFIDIQIGFGIMRLLNPASGFPTSVLSQLKGIMAMVLFLMIDGHHIMFRALVASYDYSPAIGMAQLPAMQGVVVSAIYHMFVIALQIAAPAAAVAFLTDATLSAVARAVPQMNVLVVGFPAKILLGVFAVAMGLPVLLWGVRESVHLSANAVWWFFNGGANP
jgi:flagellar biosynthesis protein FliR